MITEGQATYETFPLMLLISTDIILREKKKGSKKIIAIIPRILFFFSFLRNSKSNNPCFDAESGNINFYKRDGDQIKDRGGYGKVFPVKREKRGKKKTEKKKKNFY